MLKIYRGIYVVSEADIDLNEPGSWWSAYRDYAEGYGCAGALLSALASMNVPVVRRHVQTVVESCKIKGYSNDELFIGENLLTNIRIERGIVHFRSPKR